MLKDRKYFVTLGFFVNISFLMSQNREGKFRDIMKLVIREIRFYLIWYENIRVDQKYIENRLYRCL